MPNPWVSLRCDHLIPVNKAEKEQKEKWLGGGEKKSPRYQEDMTTGAILS
jgi:hypothetical protein